MNDNNVMSIWEEIERLSLDDENGNSLENNVSANFVRNNESMNNSVNQEFSLEASAIASLNSSSVNSSGSSLNTNSLSNSNLDCYSSSGLGSTSSLSPGVTSETANDGPYVTSLQQPTFCANNYPPNVMLGAQATVNAMPSTASGGLINIAAAISLGTHQQQQQPQQQNYFANDYSSNFRSLLAAAVTSNAAATNSFAALPPELTVMHLQRLLQQYQQQQALLHRQQQLVNALAQQQLTMANHNAQQAPSDIARSLQNYALLSAMQNANEPMSQNDPNPRAAAAQEFSTNGVTFDNYNRNQQQQQQLAPTFNSTVGASITERTNSASLYPGWQMSTEPNAAHAQSSHIAAAAAVATKQKSTAVGGAKKKRYDRNTSFNRKICVFCKNNREPTALVTSHTVRDNLGRVLCPRLRTYECPICHASGDTAHTLKYCPNKPIITMEMTLCKRNIKRKRGNFNREFAADSCSEESSSLCLKKKIN